MAVARSKRIRDAVLSWPGVEAHRHRFGGEEYRLGRREIGHLHGESLVDVPLPRRVRDRLVREGKARPHHVLPDSGWVSVSLRSERDVDLAVETLRTSYELAVVQRRKRRPPSAASR